MQTAAKGAILIVDDEPHALRALQRLFRADAVSIHTAGSGIEALQILDRHDIDLLITDQRMPQMNGSELIKEACRRHQGIDCMMLSGYNDHDALAEAINSGQLSRFIPKPWDSQKLRQSVLGLIEQRQQNHLHREQQRNEQALLRMFRVALRQGQLSLHYQPKIDLFTDQLCGAEALCRWTTTDGEIIPPLLFVTLAERHQLIEPLGNWVLEQACEQLSRWRQNNRFNDLPMAVNITPGQLQQNDFATRVLEVLNQRQLAPRDLILELVENALLSSDPVTQLNIRRLQSEGVALSIDDFGSEYSNFSYLCQHAFNQLKLDKSLIDDLDTHQRKRLVVQAILQMARSMEMDVVAEGVENEGQANALRLMGCRSAQGFLFSAALPADQFEHAYLPIRAAS
ncbi:EAL domain-containing response regulator [Motiliproteus sediminis]|uniref:EAL domain-containing response regulator n=1 Tax=Motiliproteus sediminis TaxID=1468178 RepID=UPI001AEF6416|nr:EAL domain-containing protein [Motiliproteus sediminis]